MSENEVMRKVGTLVWHCVLQPCPVAKVAYRRPRDREVLEDTYDEW